MSRISSLPGKRLSLSFLDVGSFSEKGLWSGDAGGASRAGCDSVIMDTLSLLFRDVGALPIVTGAAQELWLGITSGVPESWNAYAGYSDVELVNAVYPDLRTRFQKLRADSATNGVAAPELVSIIRECLAARRDIYTVRRSKLRRYVRRMLAGGARSRERLVGSAYDIAELLSLLPDDILERIAENSTGQKRLPQKRQVVEWAAEHIAGPAWQAAVDRSHEARTIMVAGYLRYVLRIARSYMGQGVEYLDLVQEGALGLMRAAERFDYREGARLATYASSWIRQAIVRAISDQRSTIRVPVHMVERIDQLRSQVEAGQFATLWDAAVASQPIGDDRREGMNREADRPNRRSRARLRRLKARRRANRIVEYCQPLVPVDLPLDNVQTDEDVLGDTDTTLADWVIDESMETLLFQQVDWQLALEKVWASVGRVTARDVEVICLRYGLGDGEEHTLEEVGQRFGLTRERIRQIEKRMLTKMEQAARSAKVDISSTGRLELSSYLPPSLSSYLNQRFGADGFDETSDVALQSRVDRLLSQLPRGDWHMGTGSQGKSRRRQLKTALQKIGMPAHYKTVTQVINATIGDDRLDASYVYALLTRYEDGFARLGEGYFGLAEWERERANEDEPVLPFCPAPLPDPPGSRYAFFESVVVTHRLLETARDTTTLLTRLAQWADLEWPQPRWVCQSVLSTYYLVGVIPYVYYTPDKPQPLPPPDLPHNLMALREHCLNMLTGRLLGMPQLWWLLRRHQPVAAARLTELYVEAHPFAPEDVVNRLTLLHGIDAVRRTPSGRYELTSSGESVASRLACVLEAPIGGSSGRLVSSDLDFAEVAFA